MTKPTPKARRKDLTGVNLAAIKKRLDKLEQWLEALTYDVHNMNNFVLYKRKK